jgi:hypothetical protein
MNPLYDEPFDASSGGWPAVSRRELSLYVRQHTRANLYDESSSLAAGVAIYGLSDPRDIREVRYIGQTRTPMRRFLQHINAARLWLPEELPWWIKAPELRPLYGWIRALYSNGKRLPVMVVSAWKTSDKEARLAERTRIIDCLREHRMLLNVEMELLGRQLPLV